MDIAYIFCCFLSYCIFTFRLFTLVLHCKNAFTYIYSTLYNVFTNKMSAKRKIISVNEQTYLALKRLGLAGDSFNDVLSKMLKNTSCSKKAQNVEEAEA
jgi:hypothetical protein